MSKHSEKVTMCSRSKKNSKVHGQKGGVQSFTNCISECTAKSAGPPAHSKESLTIKTSVDGNHIETLVGEEKSKHPSYTSLHSAAPEYEIFKRPIAEVDFGGGSCGEYRNGLPRIVDLCVEDKKRILQLVNELANCKEEKEVMSKELTTLKETVQQQRKQLGILEEKFSTQKEALALEVENLVTSRDNLSVEVTNLHSCVEIQKYEIEKQTSCIASLKTEKKQLQIQLSDQENQLKAALAKITVLSEKLMYYGRKANLKNESVQAPTPHITDNKAHSIHYIHQAQFAVPAQSSNIKVNETDSCMNSEKIQKIEDWDQLLISELFFRSKDVPETLEPIFFKGPYHAQPTPTWDTLL